MDIVVLVVLVIELVVAVGLLVAARRLRVQLRELGDQQANLGSELSRVPAGNGLNPVLAVEILNAREVAAQQSWAARTFGGLVPRLVAREVATRAAQQMSSQLAAQGVEAEVRVVSPASGRSDASVDRAVDPLTDKDAEPVRQP